MSEYMNQAYLSELAKEPWAMQPEKLTDLFTRISSFEASPMIAAIENARDKAPQTAMTINGETATIHVTGVLMKTVPAYFKWLGIEATGYDAIRNDIASVSSNPKIKNVNLDISSPGGQVSGVDFVVDDLKSLRQEKNVTACVNDLCASAGYMLASQAGTIEANRGATIGSIGVYMVITDLSKMAENQGVKVNVISSGEFKGTGVPGTEITDKQLQPFQEIVSGLAAQFVSSVAEGRDMGITNVQALATGRMWLAAEAKELGLIDTVINSENSDGQIEPSVNSNIKDKVMSEKESQELIETAKAENEKEVMGKFDQMLAAFPENQEFAITQFKAGASLDQAKIAYADVLAKENADLKAGIEAKDKEIADAKATETVAVEGADAINTSGTDSSSGSKGDFIQQAHDLAKEKGIDTGEAMKQIARSDPDSYYEFVEKCPPARKPRKSK